MSLIEHSTPAERERGCSWADAFESQAAVEAYGATVNGAPTFSARDGVTLDGTNDYLTYNLTGQEFNSDEISVVIEFTPDFAPDEDANSYLCSTTNGSLYTIFKRNNAAGNGIGVYLGNTSLGTIAESAYSSIWKTCGRNILVCSGTTGATKFWLNGTLIGTFSTAWTVKQPTQLLAGCAYNTTGRFDGTIHRLQVYKTQLEDQEALDICSGETYRYLDDASLILTGAMEDHDPTNHRVLDRSGKGNHVTLGDGAGSNEPTKLPGAGYACDGVDDYFGVPLAVWPGAEGTVLICGMLEDNTGNGRMIGTEHSSGNNYELRTFDNAGTRVDIYLGYGTGALSTPNRAPTGYGRQIVLGMAWAKISANTYLRSYADGELIGEVNAAGEASTPDTAITIATWNGQFMKGRIYCAAIFPSRLTSLQIADLTHRMRSWARGV